MLIRGDGTIIAGHGWAEAAKLLGMARVPTITIKHLSEDQIRAYLTADNQRASWRGRTTSCSDRAWPPPSTLYLSFNVTLTGFEFAEIDVVLGDEGSEDDEESVPERPTALL